MVSGSAACAPVTSPGSSVASNGYHDARAEKDRGFRTGKVVTVHSHVVAYDPPGLECLGRLLHQNQYRSRSCWRW